MTEYKVYFTQTFVAHGWRTVAAPSETDAVNNVFEGLGSDPAVKEIDDSYIEIDEVEEI